MAVLSPTVADVLLETGGQSTKVIAGATVTQGDAVYSDAADDNEYKPAVNTSVEAAAVKGLALNAAEDGQPLNVAIAGVIQGFGASEGVAYFLSSTDGVIGTEDEIGSGDFCTFSGWGTSDGDIVMTNGPQLAGFAKP